MPCRPCPRAEQAGVGVGGGRGVQPQPCPAGPTPRVAPAKPRRDFARRPSRPRPRRGRRDLPHLVRTCDGCCHSSQLDIPGPPAPESPGCGASTPTRRQNTRSSRGDLWNEVLDRVHAGVARLALQRILELAGCKELLLQHPRAAEVIAGGQTALGQPLPRPVRPCAAHGATARATARPAAQSWAMPPSRDRCRARAAPPCPGRTPSCPVRK